MSTQSNASAHDAGHSPATDTTRQLLLVAFFGIVVPLVLIVSLVRSVTFGNRTAVAPEQVEMAVMQRIQKVGAVSIGNSVKETRTGEQVFKTQCTNCHLAGLVGAPKFGDAGAWAPRIKTGFDALLNSALKGKNAMGAQGGGEFTNFEIARAVVFMSNAGGAKFAEPAKPADPAGK